MNSEADYWASRREELLEQMERDETALQEKLAKVYDKQVKELERDIAAYYQRYGENNVVEYRKLMVSLSESDRRLLIERMDDFAKKYPEYAHLLPIRESIYKLNELEGIQTSIRLQQLEIGAIEQGELETHFQRQAQRAANLAAEQLGFGSNFYGVNAQVVTETVGASWAKGKAFSDTIWDNREKLAAYLNDDFAQMVARGVSYDACAKALSEKFESATRNQSKRLIYTEGTFLFNEAQAQVHETDFECYALSCADSNACKICKDIQAEQSINPARFDDRSPGVNFPPLHPWCRCSYTVEVEDWDAWIDDYVAKHGGDSLTHAARLRNEAINQEHAVSPLLQSLEGDAVKLAGFDFRIKGESSLARKIRSDAAYAGCSEEKASELIHDVLRYTYVLPENTFVEEFVHIREVLHSEGYNLVEVKNTLKLKRNGYRGVNTKVATSDGYVFELQFHTETSLNVKEHLNHPLYEKARLQETTAEERERLTREMVENSAKIPTPPKIEEVEL